MHRTSLLAAVLPAAMAADSCPSAYLIAARASTEPPGFGIIGGVKDQILAMVPGSSAEAVDYPATLDNYFSSETQGVIAMRNDITSFVDRCPKVPIVAMGYSQGAQVTGDAIAGQDDQNFAPSAPANQSIAQKYADQIACIILMGDPSFTPSESFHVGNASHGGYFPRENVQEFNTLGLDNKIQSYCDSNDMYCDSGNSTLVHIGYVNEYGTQAANYCVNKLSALGISTSNSTGNGTSTGGSGSNTTSSTYSMASPSATMVPSPTGAGSGGASATGSSGGAGSTGSSAPAPTMSASSGAAPLTDVRFMGVLAGALVAGFFALA